MKYHFVIAIMIALYSQDLPAAEQPEPEVWMAVLHLPRDLAERESEWRDVLRNVDGFKFWSAQLDWNANGTPGNLVRLLHAKHIDIVYQQSGGHPNRYIVQSWYTHPTADEVLPESNPDTLTGLVRSVIQRVKAGHKP